jgi:hypothetical protein
MPGVSDLYIPGLFKYVEIKKEHGGVIIDVQQQFADRRIAEGYTVLFCYGYDDAIAKIEKCIYNGNRLIKNQTE